MWSRLFLVLTAAFFITMNILLVRSEFGGRNDLGSTVPAEMVWKKVLTAPDNSLLEIRHHGMKIGDGRWLPAVSDALATGKRLPEDVPPEGMVKALSNYTIDFDANFSFDELTRLRLVFTLKLDTNQNWQVFHLRLSMRPSVWEITAAASEQTVHFLADDGDGPVRREFKFSDFQNPEKILSQFGGSALPGTLAALGLSLRAPPNSDFSPGFQWEARTDWLQVGHDKMRVYRLRARLLDRIEALIYVSPEGEIMRVELPDEIVLMHQVLTTL